MLWSFIAVCLSAWLYVDASYRGPAWQRWVFKPVTLLLLLLLAWQAPMFDAISYLVLAGRHFYRHDAGHGLAGGRTVVLPPNSASPFGLYRRDAVVHRQYRLAG